MHVVCYDLCHLKFHSTAYMASCLITGVLWWASTPHRYTLRRLRPCSDMRAPGSLAGWPWLSLPRPPADPPLVIRPSTGLDPAFAF